ncbi:MAG TPA: hypothetical protein VIK25_15345 [Gemmatimonadaceae bacterium]
MNDDWADFLFALLNADARFLVIGAHALAAHGVPRATQDLDVWVDSTGDNPGRVLRALAAFGAPVASLKVTVADLARPDAVIQIGVPPTRIDLLTSISGVSAFAQAWDARLLVDVRGRQVPFLDRQTLIQTKRATGRHKDLGDLEALGELGTK